MYSLREQEHMMYLIVYSTDSDSAELCFQRERITLMMQLVFVQLCYAVLMGSGPEETLASSASRSLKPKISLYLSTGSLFPHFEFPFSLRRLKSAPLFL